jgi:Ca-activated chloride channel homolog
MGRHGMVSRSRRSGLLAAGVVCAAVAALSAGVVRWTGGDDAQAGPVCDGPAVTLKVGADAAVAPWLSQLVASYTTLHHKVSGRCIEPSVTAVAGPDGVDAWVPDSTGTVGLARLRGAQGLGVPATSIASSPIVLGLPRDAVQLLARKVPAGRPPRLTDLLALARDPAGWGLLATGEESWGPVRFSTPDPGTTTVGASLVVCAVAGLTGVQPKDLGSSGYGRVDTRNNLLGFTRTLIANPPTARQLMDTARRAAGTAQLLRSVGIVAVREQDVWDYDGRNPAVPLQAVYPVGGQLAADVPYVVPESSRNRAAAEDLLAWLRSRDAQDRLDRYGMRRADGTAGAGLSPERGVSPQRIVPEPAPAPDGYAGAQAAWTLITRPTSTLTVLDVSGSMAEPVPGTGKTKLDLARAAGIASLEFTGPRDSLGLWEFSANLGRRDYRALVPLGPVGQRVGPFRDRRAAAGAAYQRLVARTDTGLYDTVLAAYEEATRRYRADAVNTVVVISDGVNDDPTGGLNETALLRALRARYDARRPVHIVTLGYGAQADQRALAHISSVTHGLRFAAPDPRRLNEVFVAAVTAYRLKP